MAFEEEVHAAEVDGFRDVDAGGDGDVGVVAVGEEAGFGCDGVGYDVVEGVAGPE